MNPYLIPLFELLEQHSNLDNAAAMKAYMKNRFSFFGIKAGPRREIQKQFISENALPIPFDPIIYRSLWQADQREFQMVGLDLLRKQAKKANIGDIALIEELIVTKSWWDSVDGLASWVCGPYFLKFPEQTRPITDGWAVHKNMWLRRASIIFQLGYKGETDFQLLKEHIELNLGTSEFFINKAIGWALREYGKTEPEQVVAYVSEMKDSLSPLSYREAMKNLR